VRLYGKLNRTILLCRKVTVADFDQAAGDLYQQMLIETPSLAKKRLQKDMRIAAIALSIGAILVTRNHQDFCRVSRATIRGLDSGMLSDREIMG
jgi:tRNA(fMet)-specific endonuclease VapC